MNFKTVTLMTKSAKNNNYCVSGFTPEGKFVRPISKDSETGDAVPPEALIATNGELLDLFDIVEIPVLDKPVNNAIQPENFYYIEKQNWKKIGKTSLNEIIKTRGFDKRKKLFYNTERAIGSEFVRQQLKNESLLFVLINDFYVTVDKNSEHSKYRANFKYNDNFYKQISIGDIKIREIFQDKSDGEYFFKKEAAVIMSLTNPFHYDEKCYKMIAQVF